MQEKIDKISPIKKRILQFIESKGISKADFARNAGMSYENLKGKSLISELAGDKIGEILTLYPEISAKWLLTGNGDMLKSDNARVTPSNLPESELIVLLRDQLKDKERVIAGLERERELMERYIALVDLKDKKVS